MNFYVLKDVNMSLKTYKLGVMDKTFVIIWDKYLSIITD